MNGLFTSSGYSAADTLILDDGSELSLASLPAFLRVLLITDGTVTKSLESYFWEPVQVIKYFQQSLHLDRDLPSIDKRKNSKVIARKVYLKGQNSHTIYAYAYSYIRAEVLPESIRLDLERNKVGVGELLRECGLETFRELLCFGRETPDGQSWITRTYRIVMDKRPFIEITEKFPLAVFND